MAQEDSPCIMADKLCEPQTIAVSRMLAMHRCWESPSFRASLHRAQATARLTPLGSGELLKVAGVDAIAGAGAAEDALLSTNLGFASGIAIWVRKQVCPCALCCSNNERGYAHLCWACGQFKHFG
eukprot:4760398-Amphidinium_carterae.1